MIIEKKNLDPKSSFFGPKTTNLKRLAELDLRVPNFIAISPNSVVKLKKASFKDKVCQNLLSIAAEKLENKLIVRSSALSEDTDISSKAGKFNSQLASNNRDLIGVIKSVINQADNISGNDLTQFSLIVQNYIKPDINGITFTRNPLGNREMLVNYHQENVAQGQIKAKEIKIFWTKKAVYHPELTELQKLVFACKKIEKSFSFPQDIEWVLSNSQYYFVQSRPITSLSKKKHRSYQYLDNNLPKNQKFIYQQTQLTEQIPKPTQFTFNLLEKIYAENGPIEKVYSSYGLNYKSYFIFKKISEYLFVDKLLELKSLYPAFTYKNTSGEKIKIANLAGLITSIKNMISYQLIEEPDWVKLDKLEKKLLSSLLEQIDGQNLENLINIFLDQYYFSYEANLLLSKLTNQIKNYSVVSSQISLLPSDNFFYKQKEIIKLSSNWQGNSIEVDDYSEFFSPLLNISDQKIANGNNSEIIKKYQRLLYFRELARIINVKYANLMRLKLRKKAQLNGLDNYTLLFFATYQELATNNLDKTLLDKRANNYLKCDYDFPQTIASFTLKNSRGPKGISIGVDTGKLITLSQLEENINMKNKVILYHENLSPNLVPYLDQISGLITNNGSILSHLAILLREKKIPGIINAPLLSLSPKIGDKILMNGLTGKIEKVDL